MIPVRINPGRTLIPRINLAMRHFRLHDEEGQSIVETAMSLTILITFMFAVFEVGLALYSYHFVSEAAREGTRYAIVRGFTAGSTNCTAPGPPTCRAQGGSNTGDIATYVKYLGFPGINPNNMTVNSTWSAYPTGTSCTPSASCNNPGNLVTITVQYSFPVVVPFVPNHTYTMTSQSAMIIAQ
jgi:Flp pilus assembly protein TadG